MPSDPAERHRWALRRVTCEAVAELLPGVVDGGEQADRRIQRHIETCLRCQAELAQYRKLLRVLHHLRTDVLEPAPGVLAGILANLEQAGEQAVATAAAGAAGAIVLVSRGRRRIKLAG